MFVYHLLTTNDTREGVHEAWILIYLKAISFLTNLVFLLYTDGISILQAPSTRE